MAKKALRTAAIAIWLGGFGLANLAMAQGVQLTNPLGSGSTLSSVVASVTKFLIVIAVPLTAIMALVGGFQMITSAGNPEKFSSGRKTLIYAALGFVVVLLASSVAYIIKSLFAGT